MHIPDLTSEVKKTANAVLSIGSTTVLPPTELDEERRSARRVQTAQNAVVRTILGSTRWIATIRDCSPGGLGIVVQQRFVAGETLIVEWNHGFLIGTVRHSRPGRDGWVTGIQLESVRSQRNLIAEMVASERKARVKQLL